MTPSCSPRQAGSKHVFLTLKCQFKILPLFRSGQGQRQIMTQVGQYAHPLKRLHEPSCLAPFTRLFLHPVATYWRKRIVTSFDPGDLLVSPDRQTHPDLHRWGE